MKKQNLTAHQDSRPEPLGESNQDTRMLLDRRRRQRGYSVAKVL